MAQLDNTIVNGILRAQTIATNILKDATGSAGTVGQVMTVNSSGQAVWATGYAPATSGAFATYASSAGYAADAGKLNGQAASYYRNASNLNNGTVPNAVLPSRLQELNTVAANAQTLSNGFYYVSTATYAGNPFYYLHTSNVDFQILNQGYSTAWGNQLARDFRSNKMAIRNSNNSAWTPWAEVWTTANIGLTYKGSMQMTTDNSVLVCRANTQNWTTNIVYSTRAWKSSVRIKWRAVDNTHYLMMGLDAAPTEIATNSWNALDYAFYLQSNGKYDIRESGTTTTPSGNTYAANDEFAIEYTGENIYYYKNGALIRTVARTIGNPLCAAGTFYNEGAIKDFEIHSISDLTMNPPHAGSAGYATSAGSADESKHASSAGYASSANVANYLASKDQRNGYPVNVANAYNRIGASFMNNSRLGIDTTTYGNFSDVIVVRGYSDSSGGSENALIFNKNNASIWHTQFPANASATWGTPCLIIDSNNIKSQSAGYATTAGNALYAVTAQYVVNGGGGSACANYASSAGYAATAGHATECDSATYASSAYQATYATHVAPLRTVTATLSAGSNGVNLNLPSHTAGILSVQAPAQSGKTPTQRLYAVTVNAGDYTGSITEIVGGDGIPMSMDATYISSSYGLDVYVDATSISGYNTQVVFKFFEFQ